MADSPSSPEENKGKKRRITSKRKNSGEVLRVIEVFAAVAAVVVAIIFGVLNLPPGGGVTQTSLSPTATTSPAGGSPETTETIQEEDTPTPVPAADPKPGTCGRIEDETFVFVPCDVPHSAEIIPASVACNIEDFVRYAGGNPDLDVLHEDVQIGKVEGACSAQLAGTDLQQSFKDILRHDNGVRFRECVDGLADEVVPCSEEHTGEVVFREDPADPAELRCDERAAEYMGTSRQRHYRELKTVNTEEPPRRCVVEASGVNSLTSSLRDLGSKAVPIAPPY